MSDGKKDVQNIYFIGLKKKTCLGSFRNRGDT